MSSSDSSVSSSSSDQQQVSFDVPESVAKRFFSSHLVLQDFLLKGSKLSFLSMMKDVAKSYKIVET